jgi:hypothetical protein
MKVIVESFQMNLTEVPQQVTLALRQVDWLICIAGYFLCDDPSTELTYVPDLINQALVDIPVFNHLIH